MYGWSNESHVYHYLGRGEFRRGWMNHRCGHPELWIDHLSERSPPLRPCEECVTTTWQDYTIREEIEAWRARALAT